MEGIVARRYGEALFAVALEKNLVEEIKKDVEELLSILRQDEDMLHFLDHPKINVEEKQNTLEKIFKGNIQKDLLGLLILVLKKARQDHIVAILEYYLEEYKRYKKLVTAWISSAVELSDEQKSKLKATLEDKLKDNIDMIFEVDPELIGGLIVRVGDNVIDNSIKGKLNGLTKSLKQVQLS